MTTKEAVDHLRKELKNDKGYYHSWMCNIAMAFQDEYAANYKHEGIHKISSLIACNFFS